MWSVRLWQKCITLHEHVGTTTFFTRTIARRFLTDLMIGAVIARMSLPMKVALLWTLQWPWVVAAKGDGSYAYRKIFVADARLQTSPQQR